MSDRSPAAPAPPPAEAVASGEPEPRRRRAGIVVAAVAAVLAMVGALVFVVTQSGDEATAQPLALAFTAGESETYEIHQTMDGTISSTMLGGARPIAMDVTQRVTWEVTGVEEGVATIELSTGELSGTLNGAPIPASQTDIPPIEFRVARDGRILSAGGLALGGAGLTEGFGFPGMGQITPILPDGGEPVSPGDTWDKSFSQDFPYGDGRIEFTARSRYDRNEAIGSRDAAVIVTEMTVPLDFTLRFADVLDAFAEGAAPTGATGLDVFADASLAYAGEGSFTQTSFLDLEAQELLKTNSSGEFDISMSLDGVPQFEGEIGFTGRFTQGLERL